jgi:hypothetical protein
VLKVTKETDFKDAFEFFSGDSSSTSMRQYFLSIFRINQALAWWSSFFKTFFASFFFTSLAVRGLAVEAFKTEFLASFPAFYAHAPILLPLQR